MKEKRYHRGRLVLDCTRHNISMPTELWGWLQLQAESEGLTASSLLRKLVSDYRLNFSEEVPRTEESVKYGDFVM